VKTGDMVVLSDYWENELVIITSIDSKKDECEVLFSQSHRRDVFRLSFLSTCEVIQ
jgi:hypothetical protein